MFIVACPYVCVLRVPQVSTGVRVWRTGPFGPFSSSPTIGADGSVYVGNNDGNIYAFSSTGTLKWGRSLSTVNSVTSSPALSLDGSLVIVGCLNGVVYALASSTGAGVWNYTTGGQVTSSPAVSNDGCVSRWFCPLFITRCSYLFVFVCVIAGHTCT